MRALLVIPSSATGPKAKEYPVFPDGPLSIAAVLERKGHQVKIYDANIDGRKPVDFASFKPDLVGFSVFTGPKIASAISLSVQFKRIIPGVKVVWGDVHPSLLPEQTLREPYIDYVVIGAGEYTLSELLGHLESRSIALEEIKGLGYKKNGRIFINEPRQYIPNLDQLPDPAWHLVNLKKYWEVTLGTSRGCPHRCTFCASSKLHRGYHSDQSAERTVSQLEHLKNRYGVKFIKSFGESSCFNHQRLRRLCQLIIKKKLKLKWNCEIRASLSEEEVALMARSGCVSAGIGFESGSQRMLDFLKKCTTISELEETFHLLVKYRITPFLYILYGLPTETTEDFKMTLDLLRRLDNPPCLFMKFAPVPGTPLYKYCLKKGFIKPPEKLADWVNFYTDTAMNINFSNIPQSMVDSTVKEMSRTYATRRLRYTIKHNPSYFLKILTDPKGFFKEFLALIKYSLMALKETSSKVEN